MDLTRIVELVKERKATGGESVPQNSEEFLSELCGELEEVKEELSQGRTPHLEDELGDVFWDYLHFLYSLENEGRIKVDSVISRCEKKYEERVKARTSSIAWTQIKEKQKKELEQEEHT